MFRCVVIEAAPPGSAPPPGFDTARRFVQVIERRPDGFVELRFAIGDPDLFVEMLLTQPAFEELCASTGAEVLPPVAKTDLRRSTDPDPDGERDDEAWDWTLRDATHQRFR